MRSELPDIAWFTTSSRLDSHEESLLGKLVPGRSLTFRRCCVTLLAGAGANSSDDPQSDVLHGGTGKAIWLRSQTLRFVSKVLDRMLCLRVRMHGFVHHCSLTSASALSLFLCRAHELVA